MSRLSLTCVIGIVGGVLLFATSNAQARYCAPRPTEKNCVSYICNRHGPCQISSNKFNRRGCLHWLCTTKRVPNIPGKPDVTTPGPGPVPGPR
jgi:hypothetical protein